MERKNAAQILVGIVPDRGEIDILFVVFHVGYKCTDLTAT